MALEEFVEKRLQELAQERVETLETLEVVRENIKATDAKRATETATKYYHKWSEILRTLEVKLDKAKTRLTSIDAEIEEKTQKLRELEQKAVAKAAQRAKRIEELKDLPPEEFANLSMEDMELLQEIELAEGTAVEPGQSGLGSYDAAEAAGPEAVVDLEPAETLVVEEEPLGPAEVEPGAERADPEAVVDLEPSDAVVVEEEPGAERADPEAVVDLEPSDALVVGEEPGAERADAEAVVDLEASDAVAWAPEDLYRVALQKISSGAVGALALAEFESLIDFYEGLVERPETEPQADRVRLAVLKAVLKANSEYERVRAKAAECVSADRARPAGDEGGATA